MTTKGQYTGGKVAPASALDLLAGGISNTAAAIAAAKKNAAASIAGGSPSSSAPSSSSSSSSSSASALAAFQAQAEERRLAAEQEAARQQALAQQAYERNLATLNSAYEQRSKLLEQNYMEVLSGLDQNYRSSESSLSATVEKALQQAYISHMKSERELPQQLAAMGLGGGAAETTLAGLSNAYGSERNSLETQRAEQLAKLLDSLNQSKASAQQSYNSRLAEDAIDKAAALAQLEQDLADREDKIYTQKYSGLTSLDKQYLSAMASLLKK